MTEFPSSSEKPSSTHGRYGAWKVKRPKKFMRTYGLRRLQTYTSMMVNAWPRNTRLTNTAMSCCHQSVKITNNDPFTSSATNGIDEIYTYYTIIITEAPRFQMCGYVMSNVMVSTPAASPIHLSQNLGPAMVPSSLYQKSGY